MCRTKAHAGSAGFSASARADSYRLCSAPGGKTTHLAQLMQNKGVIYATDIHEHKIKLIEENSRRLGITIIEPSLQDAAEFKPEWASMADCVLVDAPCSGLGVLRRRLEAR